MGLRRIEVMIEEAQDEELSLQARLRGISKSDLVREAIEQALCEKPVPDDDPFLALIGTAPSSGATDVSERHDDYLADDEFAKWHRTT